MENSTLQKVISCIDAKKSFIVEAGAGSGKTQTLIESLKHILKSPADSLKKNNQRIVCITYTNVAKDEISERIEHNPLVETHTIHEFLWSVIKNYQTELKAEIVACNDNDARQKLECLADAIRDLEIEYSQYGRQFESGKISHDDVIKFSSNIFGKYPKISRITASQYPYIFIDEYQDTEKIVVDILIENLFAKNTGILTLGFFGDSMQKIYNHGIGRIESDKLEKITKEENFRCSKAVIGLLNQIRTNIQQKPAGKNLEGEIIFFHCNTRLNDASQQNYQEVINYLINQRGWEDDVSSLKVLMLTHKGIASKLDYSNLIATYTNAYSFGRERLYEKEDRFSDFLFNKIEKLCALYEEKAPGEFISFIGQEKCRLNHHSDKEKIQNLMKGLNQLRESGIIRDVLNYVYENKIFSKPAKIADFEQRINETEGYENQQRDKTFYESLMVIPYQEVIRLNQYMADSTPFSTKHGVKGAEFKNVFVVIDDTAWNQYNFNHVFCGNSSKGQFERTLNLLYMCCSRAKDKLALLALSKIDTAGIQMAEVWFGKHNVYDVTQLT